MTHVAITMRGARRILLCSGVALLCTATTACHRALPTAPEGTGPRGKFEKVWQDFDTHYSYFDYNYIDWNAIGAKYRDRVVDGTSDRELATTLGQMIGELHDYHADISTPFGTFGAPPIAYAHHFDTSVVRVRYLGAAPATTASGKIRYGMLADRIGYVAITTFAGADWGAEILNALAGLRDAAALVVDIRDNPGGSEDVAQVVASHFYDEKRVYRRAQFKNGTGHGQFAGPVEFSVSPASPRFSGPVALITNRFNGSASEEFALMMRILPNVVQIGDTTLGLGSNPWRVTMSNGWSYRVPQSIQTTPDGSIYQSVGLPPRIAPVWAPNDAAGVRDPYLDAAIAELRRRM